MNCKSAPSIFNSPFSVPNHSIKCHESISFASQISKSRISIPIGPCRARPAAQIKALYAPRGTVESPYQVLGIEESGSTLSDIKKAYKKMARKYHPDVSPPERVDEHTRKFIMVKEAYEMLSNALYDRNLTNRHNQRSEEIIEEWKMRWQSQLDELKRRSNNSSRTGRMSWGARMRMRSV